MFKKNVHRALVCFHLYHRPIRGGGGVIEWIPETQVFPAGLTDWLAEPTFLHNRCFSTANRYVKYCRSRL